MGVLHISIVVIVSALTLLFASKVYLSDKKSEVNKAFAIFAIFVSLELIFDFLCYQIQLARFQDIINKATLVVISLLCYSMAYFTFLFPRRIHKIPKLISFSWVLITVILSVVILFTKTVIKNTYIENYGSNFDQGSLFMFFVIYTIILILYSLVILIVKYFKFIDQERAQIKYMLYGTGSFLILNIIFNLILPSFTKSFEFGRFGTYSVIIFVAYTAYAILKHHLFNLKVILTETAIVVINVVTIAQVFISQTLMEVLLRSLFALIIMYGSFILLNSVKNEIKRREEVEQLSKEKTQALGELGERNKNLATLQRLGELVLNEVNLKPMVQSILDEIPKQLEHCHGALLDLTENGHLKAYAITNVSATKKIMSLIGGNLDKFEHPLEKGYSLLHTLLLENKPYESDHLSDFTSPPLGKSIALMIQRLLGVKHVIGLPLYAGTEPLGTMMFTYDVSKEELAKEDRDMAQSVADEMSLAIQRALAYQRLKDANAYLSELDKMKDEFFSMASHELNTPLAAVEGYLSMILEENMGKVDKQAREYLNRAYDSSKRLAELIMDLLNVSRIEQGRLKMKFDKVNFFDLATSVVHELQIKADTKKIYLKLEADKKKLPETWCDPDRIREVIANLAGNAIKFTEKGGVTIKMVKTGNYLQCAIHDTGRGISKLDQAKLFQKFSQVKKQSDDYQMGTGLGLYISKNFIELHKGRVWVESEEGKGATFIFEVPIMKTAPEKVEGATLLPNVNTPQIQVDSNKKELPSVVTNSAR